MKSFWLISRSVSPSARRASNSRSRALNAERRDFVAMTELAELMRTVHQDKPALEMIRRALDLDPANAALRDATERLGREVEGRDI